MPAPPPLTREQEESLLAAHRRGDADALAELLRGFQRRIYSICYRMVRNPDVAADLTQDSIVRIIQGLPSYDGRAALSTWVVRVTMNTCLSDLRKQKLRRHTSLDQAEPGEVSFAARLPDDRELDEARRVERQEQRDQLLRALSRLEPEPRAILVLRDLQDLEYEQIGVVLDLPLGTVKSRLFRARAALRRELEADESGGVDEAPDGSERERLK